MIVPVHERTAPRLSPRHLALAALAALLFASCYAAIKAGLAYAPPFRFAALRALLGGLALLLFLALTRRPVLPARRLWLVIVVLAVIGPLAGFSAMFNSPSHTGAGLASVVGNTGPLLVIVLAAVFLGERITGTKVAALVLGVAGVGLIALPSVASAGSWHATAFVLPLLAAWSGAAEGVIVKGARPGSEVLSVAAWQFVLAAPALFALSAWVEPRQTILWTRAFALLLGFLAAGATATATALWYWLVQREEVSRLSLVLFLVPVIGLALGVTLFGERVGTVPVIGVLLILAAVGTAAFARSR